MEHRLYVYCDWLPIMELDALSEGGSSIVQKYAWGLDLAGPYGQARQDAAASLTAAGGIGGLLATFDAGSPGTTGDDVSYILCYDAHGNVGQLVDLSAETLSAALVGRYEYDVYGNVTGPDDDANGNWLEEAGPQAAANAYRFSTKPFDPDTGMGDWGHRWYDPRTGRWVSRDPIGERGGANLVEYAYNSPAGLVDPLGLLTTDPADPGGVRLLPDNPNWGVGNGELDPSDLNPNGLWKRSCPNVDLPTAQRLAEEAWNRYMYHKFQTGGANEKAADYWYSVYAKWADCVAWKGSDVAVCFRRMRKDGGDCDATTTIGIANAVGWVYEGATHAYLATSPCCLSEGYGLSGGEKKDAPPTEEHGGFSCPYRCQKCNRQNRVLQYGSGAGKQGLFASDAEILDCIKSAKAKQDYNTLTYNCQHWAWETAHECGLFCPDRR